ncbi:phosphatidate cytidylyltransferase [Qipengyuania nanhaisediminis]|uniref:phosphatidate cytidylyltransferase n=1 Tax=Qipengyuania nanhaisediminis TaxID=604088 RepID=UPI0038B35DCD
MGDVRNRLEELTTKAMNQPTEEEAASASAQASGMNDLLVRFVSGVAMLAVALIALWLGGWFWIGFVVLLASLILWEWNLLVTKFGISALAEVAWQFIGALYVGAAALAIVQVRISYDVAGVLLAFLAPVIAVDIGAYFAGRTIGGPKILPSVSPKKTWAGLIGGAIAAGLVCIGAEAMDAGPGGFVPGLSTSAIPSAMLTGALIAVIAQAGDFFESWMKRRAGVKDSSNLLPGHGGIFDRCDGFVAVFAVLFVIAVVPAFVGFG